MAWEENPRICLHMQLIAILSRTGVVYNDPEYGFFGDLKELTTAEAYKVCVKDGAHFDMFLYDGGVYNYNTGRDINLMPGWTWMSNPYCFDHDLQVALGKATFANDSRIVSKNDGFATFQDGQWVGTLTRFNAGEGYLVYNAAAENAFVSFAAEGVIPKAEPRSVASARRAAEQSVWRYDGSRFADNMSVICQPTTELEADRYTIGAFVGDECRGEGRMINGRFFVTVHGEMGEKVSFRLYDALTGEYFVLDDVLKLNNSDFVKIAANGDYMFNKDGDEATPSHPYINKIWVEKANVNNNFRLHITLPSQSAGVRRAKLSNPVTAEGKLAEFHYTGAASNDIRELKEASVSSDVEISVAVSADLKRAVKTFKTLTLTVPSYMRLDLRQCSPSQPDYDAATGVVTFHNVSSTANIKLRAAVKTLDFQKPATTDNKLRFTPGQNGKDGQVDLNGVLNVGISFDEIDYAQSGGDLYLSANMSMGSITVHEATGKFDPEISLRDLGRTTIGSVPDFLTDGEVSVNLYNPLIDINIQSDIDVAGFVSGTLYAEDANGQEMARVRIPEFYIRPDGSTHVCICKYAEGVDASAYDQVVAVPQLSDIMRRIPKTVRFAAEARADASREGTMELGKSYTIQPAYSIMAPLAFDEGARIVYNDTIDGWTDDLEDIDLMEGSAIELTANVENKIPAYLTVSATAIDVQGKPIPENRIKVEVSNVINASEDGNTPVVTPLKIRLTEGEPGSVALVDGLTFRIEAASGEEGAKSIVGQTINAYNHTLKARDIKVRLVGKIIVNKD